METLIIKAIAIMHYPEVSSSPDLPELEQKVLHFWQQEGVFQRSINKRDGSEEFIFYDGPPFANGLPHYGHLLTGYMKDLVARYQTQKGHKVERRFGWDCHGLPAEMDAEKTLGVSGRKAITDFGIDKFNAQCRTSVMRYTDEWQRYVNRQGRWVDFANDYKTMDKSFMESVMWAFKQLYDKGLVYEAMRVMPYSWACETPLSNFETRLDNSYRERADKAVTVAFSLTAKPEFLPAGYSAYAIMAWTTTPWTLPSNLALAVHNELDYVAVAKAGRCLILAESSLAAYSKELLEEGAETANIVARFKGASLVGLAYAPLFPYFKDVANAFVVLAGEFVLAGEGTGVVHMAPGFGADDQVLCQAHNIPVVCPVDDAGKFILPVSDFLGMQVLEANDPVIIQLKGQGAWLKTEQYIHNYPHCWRTDTPLIYRAMPSWYVEVSKFRGRMVELNQQINWIPGHVKDGLFGKWLENAHDWSISRNRFWGTPIPVWKSNNPAFPRIDVYGSIAELEHDFGVRVEDLHKPFIDSLVRPNPDDPSGKSMMRRVGDVFDCWFESGSMPYAQVHYPFENKQWFESHFPADFITEYVAQTRGWFYTLMVLSTALFDRPPFLNCVCHGVILDENGQKLSKRLKNYADPLDLFAEYGSDALRWVMLGSVVMRGQELLIDKDGRMVRDAVRLSLKPIWNSYNFFTLYANADAIKGELVTTATHIMDRYILAKARDCIEQSDKAFANYDTVTVTQVFDHFFEVLTNWYIRRNRERFWKKEQDQDKRDAYNTLYTVLHLMVRALAPLLPFMSEHIYAGLTTKGELKLDNSVHLTNYPDYGELTSEPQLVTKMDKVQAICNAALAIRNRKNIRVRQPLASLTVIGEDLAGLVEFQDMIADEVNVKQVVFSADLLAHATPVLSLNFKILGARIPDKIKSLIPLVKKGEWQKLANGEVQVAEVVIAQDAYSLNLAPRDPESMESLGSQDAVVALDLTVTKALFSEGIARDVVRLVQQARKEADCHVSDIIKLRITGSAEFAAHIAGFKDYIAAQTFAEWVETIAEPLYAQTAEIDEYIVELELAVAGKSKGAA